MTDIRWDILQPVDVAGRFQQGYEHAQQNALQQREIAYQQRERARTEGERNALSGALNPVTGAIDPVAVRRAYVGAGDIQGAMQFDASQRTQQQAQLEQHRDRIIMGGRIFQSANVTDEPSYQRALGLARQAGVDTTDVPQHYDPQYVQGVISLSHQLSARAAGPTVLAEGASLVDPATGQTIASGSPRPPRYYPVPPGGTLQLDPSYQGPGAPAPAATPHPPAIGEVQQGYRFRGGNPADPNAWEPVQGGAGQPQAQGMFPRQDGGAFDFRTNP